ncbi:MAG: aminopeptidase N [Dehalococcoidia bacterium]|nr:aminopeptidase N [Dehalococcoidia bacterium]
MTAPTTAPTARDILTEEEAKARAARISNCSYRLDLILTAGAPVYRGDVTIAFDDVGTGDTYLCFRGKTIERLELNGKTIAPNWNGFRLFLPAAELRARNTVHVVYENEYDHGGDGFHQFIDPEDQQEYLYTNFEPYEAHRLFPCFDQPDIKADYTVSVTAPASWTVIHNAAEASATSAGEGRTKHQFEQTKRFSTYLFCVVAGPYRAFREVHNGIPIGLFCRESMAAYLDTEEVFTITRQGLDFFADFFAVPYPFGKYDQIFVPEFNAGAMENVGAVTHNEFMVFRDPPTDSQRRRRAEVILHEMAHMWFGDLVTMRWWNDLWLNESFATYMAYLSMTSATRFTNAWVDFNAAIKNWAYRQDQLVTTHPIAGQVADTDQTFLNFDGITYGKGASVLKQLVQTIGLDGFREGMREYFRRHSYGNATLGEFLGALEHGSGQDLKDWAAKWLETSSLNTVSADWQADGDRLAAMTLRQTAPSDYPTIRPHAFEVALVREVDGGVQVEALRARLSAAEADVPEAVGKARPSLVFPNYNDHGFFKVSLDADSVAFARENLERIDDELLRQLLWSSLWNMVRDQQLSSLEFLALVRERIGREPRIEMVEVVLNQAQVALARYVPEERKAAEATALCAAAWDGLHAAAEGDPKITWMRAMINAAANEADLALLARVADGQETVAGLTVDQQMRWDIATKHVAYGMDGAEERIEAEKARDASDRGRRAALRASTSVPVAPVKAEAWVRFRGDSYGSLHDTVSAMSGFNWARQRDILEPYVEKFFASLVEVFETGDKEFVSDYFGALFPAYRVERGVLARSEELLGTLGDRLPMLTRMLREANDDLLRSIRCREFAAGG